ncbi:hypothetical protein PFICI_01138 [Pestalotiopsis fici W106-1]|uniref:Uncharacterized protein n=1 Tax=Pestalotiopsis fici (strain W106-1 / CGMCC3.15140) TaxID=1229662 RepID=W3XN00_PESFW|nr:uncharacterized protein PFICI_01138 [Pestalotiopsis fici W106-1]ETS87310.1 hypothetical protein PFICI_01138 [Pestalotiopsis fici W106-1]
MSAPASPLDTGATSGLDAAAAPSPQIHDHRDAPTAATTETATTTTATTTSATTTSSHGEDDDDTHRCFICLVDEPEAELPSDWVTPCQCSLEGHQACLLTWIADLEAQGKTVKCPVCKSKIDVIDRWDPAVQLSDTLTRHLTSLSPMVLLSFGVGGIIMSSALYGMQALETFAGPQAAVRYIFVEPETEGYLDVVLKRLKNALPSLGPNDTATAQQILSRENIPVDGGVTVDWLHFFSLTLVAPALVLNRMPLGETIMIPSSLMYAIFLSDHSTDLLTWPPSGQKVLAAFPVARAFYFHFHRAVSKALDRRLAAATANPLGQQGDVAQLNPEPQVEHEEEGREHFIDVNLNLNLGGGEEDEGDQGAAANQPQGNGNAVPVRPNAGTGGLSGLLNYLAGALLWPTVSYGAGSLLRLALPASWVTKPASGPATGILQERWGRSLVGGCLFVVLKDAFFLYVKWRTTLNRPYRRIRNVDRRIR